MKQHDFTNVGTQNDLAKYRLQVSEEDLESAKMLFENAKYRGANNRAYYAIFQAVSAVLALEGVAYKRHKDTLAYFNQKYVSTEVFPKKLGREIKNAEEVRHKSDYDNFYIASKEIAKQQIETAEQLLNLATDYCQSNMK